MSNNVKIYLAIVVFGLIITGIRMFVAAKNSKARQEEAKQAQENNKNRLVTLIEQEGGQADELFSTGCASMVLDRKNGKLHSLKSGLFGERQCFDLKDIESVSLVDRSADYQYAQEMERLHSGVDRGAMANPYRGHSMREVKDGHNMFEDWYGKIVYGAQLKLRTDSAPVQIAFYNGDADVFWTEDRNLQSCKYFINALNQEIEKAHQAE